ncbi:MAG: 30S ribosome-binding factor RbfA [Patescibacteria group bacterium]
MTSCRLEKINSLIQQELSKIIAREIEVPENCLVTITSVETTADLEWAKILVSIFPSKEAKKILRFLNKKIGHLQKLLNQKLVMRPLPKIKFILDLSEDKAEGVERLLNKIK